MFWIGEATRRRERAQEFVEHIGALLAQIEVDAASFRRQPKAAVLEWLDPFYVGGHWVPEMVEAAGGGDVIGKAEKPSHRGTMEEIIAAAPEVLFVAPCGYDAEKGGNEYLRMNWPPEWQTVPAVRDGQVYALDANAYVSRPAGRLVTGIEARAKCMHREMRGRDKAEAAIRRVEFDESRNRPAKARANSF